MAKSICPYLGTVDLDNNPDNAVEYPSFENHCLVGDSLDALLLTEQATLCLAGSHRYCARYQAAAATGTPALNPAFSASRSTTPEAEPVAPSNAPAHGWPGLPIDSPGLSEKADQLRRQWGWVGAGIIFLSIFACGSLFAAYVGWQMVTGNFLAQSPASIDTLADATTPTPQPVYTIITATSPPQAIAAITLAPVAGAPVITPTFAFPQAVTPTPVVVLPQAGAAQPSNGQIVEATLVDATLVPTLDPLAPPPAPVDNGQTENSAPFDASAEIPTRRPTPIIDLPTSTPEQVVEPTATSTPMPTPTLGMPVVQFAPLEQAVMLGECTIVRWNVINVQAVYYENLPVNGVGEKEECIDDEPVIYKLAVAFHDGTNKVFTTTVVPLFPTPTLTPTPSFTPEIIPSPTWTPEQPTGTPTPNVRYATSLAVQASNPQSCAIGVPCTIGVLITNSGDTLDNQSVTIAQAGPWSPQLCRGDGVCSGGTLSLNAMGPGNTAYVNFKLEIPADAQPQTVTYGLRSISDGSGGSVMSETVAFNIEVK